MRQPAIRHSFATCVPDFQEVVLQCNGDELRAITLTVYVLHLLYLQLKQVKLVHHCVNNWWTAVCEVRSYTPLPLLSVTANFHTHPPDTTSVSCGSSYSSHKTR